MTTNLLEHQTYELFKSFGISTPPWTFVKNGETPNLASDKKFVAKIVSPTCLHKSDAGGLAFNVTAETAKKAQEELLSKFSDASGVLFVEMVSYNKSAELILGAHHDDSFGPLVTIGFGGTGTEFFNSVMKAGMSKATFPASADRKTVEAILEDLPVVKMVTGRVRGYQQLVEMSQVVEAVCAFQKLISSNSNGQSIEEAEINPLVCFDGKLLALDGVVRLAAPRAAKTAKPLEKISKLLNPKSAAIVGASGKNPMNPANIILKNLLEAGVSRDEITLIHPKETSIDGIGCAPDLKTMIAKRGGAPVDLLVIGVPSKAAAALMTEAMDIYAAHSMQVISAGFGETESGKELQKQLEAHLSKLDATPEKRPVVNGPNTLGNISGKYRTLFTQPVKNSWTGKGDKRAALICQSGAFMITAISNLADVVDPKVSMSVGNQMDISVVDGLEFLLNDKDIKSYGLYIEGLAKGDGLRLMELCRKAKEAGKSVIVYKAGRTKEGADAAKGHTAAMAGDYSLFEILLSQSGALIADSFQEFSNLIMLTTLMKHVDRSKEQQVAAISNAGYEKCAIADHLMKNAAGRFKLANYAPETIEKIKETYVKFNVSGIMDIHDILDLTPMMPDDGYEAMIRATLADPNVTVGLYSIVPETFVLKVNHLGKNGPNDLDDPNSLLSRIVRIMKELDKPFVMSMESGWRYDDFAAKCIESGIPCFRRVDQAAQALAKYLL